MADFGLKPDAPPTTAPKIATDLLAGIKPRAVSRTNLNLEESDKAAERIGFTSREPKPAAVIDEPQRRRRRKPEPTSPLSMRLRNSIHARFIDYAEARNLSYPAALELLLDESERLRKG
jgi:hypothetical protein